MMTKHLTRQAGVAIVELALILPLLLVLSFIAIEFGRAMYEYNTLLKSARDAVRFLSVQDPTIKTTDPTRVTQARNLAVYGLPTPGDSTASLLPHLTLSNVPDSGITWSMEGSDPAINTVTIEIVNYRFVPMISEAFGISIGDAQGGISFNTIRATMRAPS